MPAPVLDPRLVFLDLETSGLDPQTCHVLEVGIVIVSPDLEAEASFSRVVRPPLPFKFLHLEPEVRLMHERSGLLSVIRDNPVSAASKQTAEVEALAFLFDQKCRPGTLTLAGYCPQFDESFLKLHMPGLARMFDYRHLDVSSIRSAVRRLVPGDFDAWWRGRRKSDTQHRVIADCMEALDELRFYREALDFANVSQLMGNA